MGGRFVLSDQKTTGSIVRLEKTPCSNCNSPQRFIPRRRDVSEELFEIYIQCDMCKKIDVLYLSNDKIEKLRRKVRYLTACNNQDPRINKLNFEINQEKRRLGINA